MKKYKLIKWYPSLPPVWKTVSPITVAKRVASSSYYYSEAFTQTPVSANQVENNPEFWQEIVEFRFITHDGITICDPKQVLYSYEVSGKIVEEVPASIAIRDILRWLQFSTREARTAYIESLKPKFIFTSHDNLNVFDGQTYLALNPYNWMFTKQIANVGAMGDDGLVKFVSESSLKEYVLQNKPLISLNDIMQPENTAYFINLSDSNKGKLRALVQSRLE